MKLSYTFPVLLILLLVGCKPPTESSDKSLTAFSIGSPAVEGTIAGTNIDVTVPYGAPVTRLVATFTTTGVSVNVGSVKQVSGQTINDFTSPVYYVVKAENGSTKTYVVTVTVADVVVPASYVSQTITTLASSDGTNSWTFSPSTNLSQGRGVTINLSLPSGGDVYYILTNTSTGASARASVTRVGFSVDAPESSVQEPVASPPRATGNRFTRLSLADVHPASRARPQFVAKKTGKSKPSFDITPGSYVVGTSTWTFIDAFWDSAPAGINKHDSHLQKQVLNVAGRTLNIWVSDDAWSTDGTTHAYSVPSNGTAWVPPTHLVTLAMVDALAARFLNDGVSDIYTWNTTVLGKEWDAADSSITYQGSPMIDSKGNIHIFVTNLNPAGTTNGVLMGYFHDWNNYEGASGSNEKLLFALDADSLANPADDGNPAHNTNGWLITDYWPAEIVSTLAHEFQHMIHFYQKQVSQDISTETDTWINEMASLMMEDLVSEKLGVPGPRGVLGTTFTTGAAGNQDGRLPDFNYWHESIALTGWGDNSTGYSNLDSYSNAYAFGAWLLRNYGGPKLLNALVTNDKTDFNAVVDAVHTDAAGTTQTYATLVRDWGLATFLRSSSVRPGLIYANDPTSTAFSWPYGTTPVTYKLGSIDLGNYTYSWGGSNPGSYAGPYVYPMAHPGNLVEAGASYFQQGPTVPAGGTLTKTFALPPNVTLTVVVTP